MKSGKELGGDENRIELSQFLSQVYPKELEEINCRREVYNSDSDEKIKLVGVDLKPVVAAEEKFRSSKVKFEGLKGFRRVMTYIQQLNFPGQQEKESFESYATKCRENFTQKSKDLKKSSEALRPSVEHGLIGLAFSGGGIRSATFNFGVLQALAKNKILKYVDYLSTVSGGGYIGSCLSSIFNLESARTDWDQFAFRHIPGEEEPDAIKELRNGSTYLAPDGLLDKIRIPALLLRGIIINFLVFLPYIILAVALTGVIYKDKLELANKEAVFKITEKSLIALKDAEYPPSHIDSLSKIILQEFQKDDLTRKFRK